MHSSPQTLLRKTVAFQREMRCYAFVSNCLQKDKRKCTNEIGFAPTEKQLFYEMRGHLHFYLVLLSACLLKRKDIIGGLLLTSRLESKNDFSLASVKGEHLKFITIVPKFPP